jgi:endoglucanase
MKRPVIAFYFIPLLLLCLSCVGNVEEAIHINQIGFHPMAGKTAVAVGSKESDGGVFHVIDEETGQVAWSGKAVSTGTWTWAGTRVATIDFTELRTPGTYRIQNKNGRLVSPMFAIHDTVYNALTRAALRAFYYNRASIELEPEHAGRWARAAGHPDTLVHIHASAVSADRPVGTAILSPGGWYDAGDYNKYIVNSGISTYTLLAAYEDFPDYFHNLSTSIPESGDGMPDILSEARWNLEWMLTMQDPGDGGVYHKLTSPQFSGVVMPHEDTDPRYVVQKSTAATLNFAAVMAVAARVYGPHDPGFALRCLSAARSAWEWAVSHPEVYYRQAKMNERYRPAIVTGEYGDTDVTDEFDWAATELYLTTGGPGYLEALQSDRLLDAVIPNWRDVRALACLSSARHFVPNDLATGRTGLSPADRQLAEASVQCILNLAGALYDEYRASAFRVSMGHDRRDFVWGSNAVAMNHSILLIQAWRLTGDRSWLDAALANLDYVLGRNPTGYSFVTGFGSRTPMFPHHRPSAADGLPHPVPGFLVGGPQGGQQDGCTYPSNLPALSYLDDWCSYSTNEVAINWNAPLVYVSGALQAIYQGGSSGTTGL